MKYILKPTIEQINKNSVNKRIFVEHNTRRKEITKEEINTYLTQYSYPCCIKYYNNTLVINFNKIPLNVFYIQEYILKNTKDKKVECLKEFKKSLSKYYQELCLQFFDGSFCKAFGYYNRWCNNYNENFTPSVWLEAYGKVLISLRGWTRYRKGNNWIYENPV